MQHFSKVTIWKQKLYKLVNNYSQSALDFEAKMIYSIKCNPSPVSADRLFFVETAFSFGLRRFRKNILEENT